jgi:hypothetical protein
MFLFMEAIIRKKKILPDSLETVDLDAVFRSVSENPERPESARIEGILGLLSSLGDLTGVERGNALARLRMALSRYVWVSRVISAAEGYRVVQFPANTVSDAERWEYGVVWGLLELVPLTGKRPRIRRCDQCERWFFAASRDDQKFCSGVCRQRNYDGDDARREEKRKYMQKRYADEKARAKNIKSGVGLRSRKARPVSSSR